MGTVGDFVIAMPATVKTILDVVFEHYPSFVTGCADLSVDDLETVIAALATDANVEGAIK